jgi:hypothetical protein
MEGRGMDVTDSAKRQVTGWTGCSKHGNETSGSKKNGRGIHSVAEEPFSF